MCQKSCTTLTDTYLQLLCYIATTVSSAFCLKVRLLNDCLQRSRGFGLQLTKV